jgi:phospholipid N-methyltransferase
MNMLATNSISCCMITKILKPGFLIQAFYLYNCWMKTQRDTPEWLAKKMVSIIETDNLLNFDKDKLAILEPSAGSGAIVDQFRYWLRKYITCVELNKEKYDILKTKDNLKEVIHGDFLKQDFGDKKFDFIIAAPPFKNNDDIHHIIQMFYLLKKHGTIVTLTTPYWTVNNEPQHKLMRYFLTQVNYTMEMLPDETFMEKGKTVPTALLTITNKI